MPIEKCAKDFVGSFVAKLKALKKPEDLSGLYKWFWEQKDSYPKVTNQMN